jgi:hypothetical protein
MTLSRLASIGFVLFGAAGAAVATEEPQYRIERNYGSFEVRVYGRVVVAETAVSGSR